MSNVTIREVTEDDYDAVLKIRRPEDIFHGLDYLPDYYKMIFKTPGYKGYAAVVDGKIVAFEFACVLDGGQTLVTRAGRVSKSHSGKGIMKTLTDFVVEKYSKYPNVRYSSSTFNNEVYGDKVQKVVTEGRIRLVHQKNIMAYRSSFEEIRHLLKDQQIPNGIDSLSRKDISELFHSKKLCRQLFPDDQLVIDWVPYRPMESNVPFIFTERCNVFGSNIGSSFNFRDSLLTFGSFVILNSVVLLQIDVYGSGTNALRAHIIAHLKTLGKGSKEILQLELFCSDDIDKTFCNGVAKGLGFKHFDLFRKNLFCTVNSLKKQTPENMNLETKSKI